MFCSNCGKPLREDARYCASCGKATQAGFAGTAAARETDSRPGQSDQPIVLAFYLKTGFARRAEYLLWVDPATLAMIPVGPQTYSDIQNAGRAMAAAGNLHPERAVEQAFRDYARKSGTQPLAELMAANPGGVSCPIAQVILLQVIATYDDDMRRYDPYERFILELPTGKYKGVIERDTALSVVSPVFASLLGYRYQYKTISGFPFV